MKPKEKLNQISRICDEPEPLEAHLGRLERMLLDPAVRRDRGKAGALLAPDFREFGSSGKAWSREEILTRLETEVYAPLTMEDFCCKKIAESVALVTYRAIRTDPGTGARSISLRSSVWTHESGAWRIAFHQGTRTDGQ